mgnify:CR=1 FL=1|tara:strand:- start:627 stop:1052 length:426 start_codon:yes stop_codon:yes gene_type:complete
MLKNLFKKTSTADLINASEDADVVLRLMFEIAISDGNLDESELKIIKERAMIVSGEDKKVSSIIKKIIDEAQESVSFYPYVKKINETHNDNEKKDLLKILWELVTADSIIDAYEENLYFKIAELLKIKRSIANQIKQQNSA